MDDYAIDYRDNIVILSQNNTIRKVSVEYISHTTLKMLSFAPDEQDKMINSDISNILASSTLSVINDYLEYESFGKSLDDILRKLKFCDFVNKNGSVVRTKVKSTPYISNQNPDNMSYILYIRSLSVINLFNNFITMYNYTPPIKDKITHMYHDAELNKLLEIYSSFVQNNSIDAVAYSLKTSSTSFGIANISKIINTMIREYDLMGYASTGLFMILTFYNTDPNALLARIQTVCQKSGIEYDALSYEIIFANPT
ncbi:MAG: hypothetical protein P857_807 [Candidatus Xenolissoclinum pacificiensis L6]|uniref:Uncharacterized protein n=1 Tax=Candidatus Xenolissoclinum pacificiensis L6 TaxID=1401685 RepID=W2V1V4_9RICK|nr:MAG: hypothetical protein P857_807 [Candidatus Xenolissoclinum pacificiensis L6]